MQSFQYKGETWLAFVVSKTDAGGTVGAEMLRATDARVSKTGPSRPANITEERAMRAVMGARLPVETTAGHLRSWLAAEIDDDVPGMEWPVRIAGTVVDGARMPALLRGLRPDDAVRLGAVRVPGWYTNAKPAPRVLVFEADGIWTMLAPLSIQDAFCSSYAPPRKRTQRRAA